MIWLLGTTEEEVEIFGGNHSALSPRLHNDAQKGPHACPSTQAGDLEMFEAKHSILGIVLEKGAPV